MFRVFFLIGCLTGGSLISATSPIKDYSLKNQNSKAFQLHDMKGNFVLVSFIYTRCPMPKMCPLTMSLNKQVFKLWRKTAPKTPLKFLIVTLDPQSDTPDRLKEYGQSFGMTDPAFILATGSDQTISDLSSEFNALGFPSGGLISHNSKTVLLGPDMVALKDYKDNEWKPEEVWKDINQFSQLRDGKSS